MTDTPDKLRALSVHIVEEEGDAPNFAANARALINEAADEIERLQSDLHAVIQSDQDALTPQEITEQNRIVRERLRPMTTETMRKKMAMAICKAQGDDWEREGPGGLMEAYGPSADAALEALRDPTEEMISEGIVAIGGAYPRPVARAVFYDMIRAALQEKT